jgi:Holliday junction resolvase RusA-like endonuclease
VFSMKRTIITIRSLDEEDSTLRGDTTNYLKTVEDALNGIAYEDDRQVQRVVGRKK